MYKELILKLLTKNILHSSLLPIMMLLYPIFVTRPDPKDENFIMLCKILMAITFFVGCVYGLRGISLLYLTGFLCALSYYVYSDVVESTGEIAQAISIVQGASKVIVEIGDKVNQNLQIAENSLAKIGNAREIAEKAIGEFNEALKKTDSTIGRSGAAVDTLKSALDTVSHQVKDASHVIIPQPAMARAPSINKINESIQRVESALHKIDSSKEAAKKAVGVINEIPKKAETTIENAGAAAVDSLKAALHTVSQQVNDASHVKIPQPPVVNIPPLNHVPKINFQLRF